MAAIKLPKQKLRLRIFAGPNGSGKSTIIKAVKESKVDNIPIDFGYYINADDITHLLKKGNFSFSTYNLKTSFPKLLEFTKSSGILNNEFNETKFKKSFSIIGNSISLHKLSSAEKIGQIIARYLREEMLRLKRRVSFETVFSHESNLDIMRRSVEAGYKVYLYFVSTESPEINKYRVKLRVAKNGHDVPPQKIEDRYYRSLKLMYKASQYVYQAFFFDNSKDNAPFELVAHFKLIRKRKKWDRISNSNETLWFKKYYVND
ncbi:MAG: toxin [Saprospiraceae bacterium]|nr:toxin [Saprospiraceae bacterium]